jgi:predicted dehydrogenase
MNAPTLSRRAFLGTAGAAAAGATFVGLAASTAARAAGSNESLSVGIIGPGGRGSGLLGTFFHEAKAGKARLTAVCDLWTRNRERGAGLVKKAQGEPPRQLKRLEDMLDMKGLDAVIIATPDHAHAQHLTWCLQKGKHVYCEKPFANVLEEANTAIDAYRKTDKVVTIGTQRRSDPRYLAARDLVKGGVLGPFVQVDVIQNAYSPYRWRRKDVKDLKEKDTDWKAFLMGRKGRRFDPHQYLEFRLYHDFSTGIIDQWMSHMIDTVHLLTGATFPKSVVAHGGTYAWKDGRENGDTVHVLLEYPQGFLATYAATLANGFGQSCRILGRQGTLEYENAWRLSGEGVKGSKIKEAKAIGRKEGFQGDMDHIHVRNWLECVHKGKRETHCTAEHGYQHAVACILADRALHRGKRQVFDEKKRTIREG